MTTTPRRARASALLGTAAALLAALTACGAPRGPQLDLPDADGARCELGASAEGLGSGGRGGPDSLLVAAPGPLEGRRPPVPSSWAERIAYRHLYGSLVEVDCRGRVRPGLASSWEAADDGLRWTFRIRDDRLPSPAETAARAWRRSGLVDGAAGADVSVGPDGEEVTVTLRRPVASPALFAGPRFAVTGPAPPSGLPPGTGSHTPAPSGDGAEGDAWVLVARAGGAQALRIVGHRGRDGASGPGPRDLLDRGADLLVTRRPRVGRYAASLPGYAVEPLPWDRTYVLLVPGRGDAPGGADAGDGRASSGRADGEDGPRRVLRDLARDAVRADARASVPPHWWETSCGPGDRRSSGGPAPGARAPGGDRPSSRPSARLLYPEGDPTAEDVAARLAALSGPGGDPAGPGALAPALDAARGTASRLRPVGLAPDRFEAALREGRAGGYVLAVPRRALVPCRSLDGLRRRVPWLAADGARTLPLVDTRPLVAVRRGLAGVRLDWDGVPRLATPGGAP